MISQLIWFGSIEGSLQCLWVGSLDAEVVTPASLSGAWTEWASKKHVLIQLQAEERGEVAVCTLCLTLCETNLTRKTASKRCSNSEFTLHSTSGGPENCPLSAAWEGTAWCFGAELEGGWHLRLWNHRLQFVSHLLQTTQERHLTRNKSCTKLPVKPQLLGHFCLFLHRFNKICKYI